LKARSGRHSKRGANKPFVISQPGIVARCIKKEINIPDLLSRLAAIH